MLRRLLWVLASVVLGAGVSLVLYGVRGLPAWAAVIIVLATAAAGILGAWFGRGPIRRGESRPRLALLVASVLPLGLAGAFLLRTRIPTLAFVGVLLILGAALLQIAAYLMRSPPSGGASGT
jgi:hypothetical protein